MDDNSTLWTINTDSTTSTTNTTVGYKSFRCRAALTDGTVCNWPIYQFESKCPEHRSGRRDPLGRYMHRSKR